METHGCSFRNAFVERFQFLTFQLLTNQDAAAYGSTKQGNDAYDQPDSFFVPHNCLLLACIELIQN